MTIFLRTKQFLQSAGNEKKMFFFFIFRQIIIAEKWRTFAHESAVLMDRAPVFLEILRKIMQTHILLRMGIYIF